MGPSPAGGEAALQHRRAQETAVHRAASAPLPHAVEPLILAASAYPKMEEVALDAERTLSIALRIFDSTTPLIGRRARALGLVTWLDLIRHRAEAGVRVRIQISDFDPLFAPSLHADTQRSVAQLRALQTPNGARVAVAASLHPGQVGVVPRLLLWPMVRRRRRAAGWPTRLWPPDRLWPATHHLKVVVRDGSAMVIGGIDIDRRRWDDPTHDQPADGTWHDVSLYVTGPAAGDAERFLSWLWDRAGPGHQGRVVPVPRPTTGHLPRRHADAAPVALFQTMASVRSRSPLALAPRMVTTSLRRGLVATIASAERLLYVENQFLRSRFVCRMLVRALRRRPHLEVVIVTPAAPDTVLFEGERGASAEQGEWLQLAFVDRLLAAAPERVDVFTLAGARTAVAASTPDRAELRGRGVVYIHAKVMIADDHTAHVSSANLNDRSLFMDTEAGVLWRDPHRVGAFRDALWRLHLGEDVAPERALATFRDVAARNADPGAHGRDGPRRFLVPWDRDAVRAAAARHRFVPNRFL